MDFADFVLPLLEDRLSPEDAVSQYCEDTRLGSRGSAGGSGARVNKDEAGRWQRFGRYVETVLWPLLITPHTETIDGVDVNCGVDSNKIATVDVGKHCLRAAYAAAAAKLDDHTKALGDAKGVDGRRTATAEL